MAAVSSKSVETWAISSVGRASPLHGGGRRFEPVIAHHASTQNLTPKWVISSVGRASPLHGGGRRFEPVITHHFGSLAQSVEQLTFNQLVAGSNPARPTIFREKHPMGAFFRFCAQNVFVQDLNLQQVRVERQRDNVAAGNDPQGEAKSRVILHDPPFSEKSTLWVLFSFLRPHIALPRSVTLHHTKSCCPSQINIKFSSSMPILSASVCVKTAALAIPVLAAHYYIKTAT